MVASNEAACPRTVVIAGTSSGVGKSSITLAVLSALRRRGLTVQAFKVGPDLLDPSYHETASGRPSVNLDGWMLNKEQCLAAFHRRAAGADVCVVEGVMGLYDARDGKSEEGSTAQMAKWLGAPAVLVLDCFALARSAAAMVKGYVDYDPALRLEGVILNRVGGDAHTQWLREAVEASGVDTRVLGGIPQDESLASCERALAGELPKALAAALAGMAEEHIDLDALLAIAATARPPPPPPPGEDAEAEAPAVGLPAAVEVGERARVRIGVARDAAFGFYYAENLRLLEAAGAELVPFSPLSGALPERCAGLYIGGGCPELHARALAAQRPLMAAVRAFAGAGGVVYAEGGGLVFLSQSLQPHGELPAAMAGVFPFRTAMAEDRPKIGYVEVTPTAACPLFPPGPPARGHVHHCSEILQEHVVGGFANGAARGALGRPAPRSSSGAGWAAGYSARMQAPGAEAILEGFSWRCVLASYVHLHFGSRPDLAHSLVARCAAVDVATVSAATRAAASAAARAASPEYCRPRRAYSTTTSPEHAPPPASRSRGGAMPHVWSSPNLAAALARSEGAEHGASGSASADALAGASAAMTRAMAGASAMDHSASVDGLVPPHWKPPGAVRPRSPSTTLTRPYSCDNLCPRSPPASPPPPEPGSPPRGPDGPAEALARAGLAGGASPTRLLVLDPRSLADVLDGVLEVGVAAGVTTEAVRLVERLRARLRAVAAAVARAPRRPRALTLTRLGPQPAAAGGQWLAEMEELAGAAAERPEALGSAAALGWDEVREYAPEVLVLAPDLAPARALGEVGALAGLPGWWALPAVKSGRVFLADGALYRRVGPRVVEGAEALARMLHPDLVPWRCPDKAVLKLALHGGQRCRQRLLANYFQPYA
ncbi:hypothetical protein WJX81_002848 [Elliptochloris bilobata]|uniref:Cobyrinic acid a,c-diamide synthase n=1 Tax=Elliptochloris bilobata TaxID=381761 RepID=A0AAW1SIP3_9CHLO